MIEVVSRWAWRAVRGWRAGEGALGTRTAGQRFQQGEAWLGRDLGCGLEVKPGSELRPQGGRGPGPLSRSGVPERTAPHPHARPLGGGGAWTAGDTRTARPPGSRPASEPSALYSPRSSQPLQRPTRKACVSQMTFSAQPERGLRVPTPPARHHWLGPRCPLETPAPIGLRGPSLHASAPARAGAARARTVCVNGEEETPRCALPRFYYTEIVPGGSPRLPSPAPTRRPLPTPGRGARPLLSVASASGPGSLGQLRGADPGGGGRGFTLPAPAEGYRQPRSKTPGRGGRGV